jgi:hypothetical protein
MLMTSSPERRVLGAAPYARTRALLEIHSAIVALLAHIAYTAPWHTVLNEKIPTARGHTTGPCIGHATPSDHAKVRKPHTRHCVDRSHAVLRVAHGIPVRK